MVEPILRLERVAKRFGDTVALHPTSLSIRQGEFIALMGPSGCGKTTTLRMLSGLESPSEGRLLMWNRDDITARPAWERDMPLVWQNYALFPFMSVRENVEFGLKQRRVPKPERARRATEWLERMGIGELGSRRVDRLSGGQRQRVALARALVLEPEILLLDEPLSALDAHLRLHMQSELKRLHRELGITFLYVTHNQSEAFAMADRVVILDKGRVQQVGGIQAVYREPANRFVAEFVGANNIFAGRVDDTPGERVAIVSEAGRFLAPLNGSGLTRGSPASFLVAADRVRIADAPGYDDNEVRARVLTEEFVGSFVTVFLALANGQEMRVQKQQSDLDALSLEPGAEVYLSWDADSAYVLPG